MSFSNDVKNELARLEPKDAAAAKAELLGLLRMSGAIIIRGAHVGIHFSTENAALARKMLRLLKDNYPVQTEVVITRSRRLKKNNRYQVQVVPAPQVAQALEDLRLLGMEGDAKNPLLNTHSAKRAYLRGAFLGGGSISRPASDYHLEMVTAGKLFAQNIIKFMRGFSLNAKLTDRKNEYIVYLKDGEGIIRFLNVIGAHNAMLELENVRIVKEMRNNANRAVNCETANLGKVVRAAMRQARCIRYIEEHGGIAQLSPRLQEVARVRLEHPDISLSDLAEFTPGLGKSGINHRLQRIQEIAAGMGLAVEQDGGSE